MGEEEDANEDKGCPKRLQKEKGASSPYKELN